MNLDDRTKIILFIIVFGALFLTTLSQEISADNIIVAKNGGDYENIQNAIDNASNGDVIEVREGTYFEDLTIKKEISLRGDGAGKSIINGSMTGDVVTIEANWVNMSGFTVTGSKNSSSKAGILVDEADHVTISNVHSTENYNGIKLSHTENIMFIDNNCSGNVKNGIYFGYTRHSTFYNNTCLRNGVSGISGDSSWDSYNFFQGNNCSYNEKNGLNGFYTGVSKEGYAEFIGNICIGNGDRGLSTGGFANCSQNICIDNKIGIYAGDRSTIYNNTCSRNLESGIYAKEMSGVIIYNNSCTGNGEAGIFLLESTDCTLSNNNCFNNSNDGIRIEEGLDNTAENNICIGSEQGITLLGTTGTILESNICDDQKYGIYLEDPDGDMIFNNSCKDNYYGINFYNSGGHTISANIIGNTLVRNGIFGNGNHKVTLNQVWKEMFISNNTVNGRSVHYYYNKTGIKVPDGGGQVILVDCKEMIVKSQICDNTTVGIFVTESSNITIADNTITSSRYSGILITKSEYCIVTNNSCHYSWDHQPGMSINDASGITLSRSSFNRLSDNTLDSNTNGFYIESSSDGNILMNNSASDCVIGVWLYFADNNLLSNNNFYSNSEIGIKIMWSGNNVIENSSVFDNHDGVYLASMSYNNTFRNNSLTSNDCGAYFKDYTCDRNSFVDNNISGNNNGVFLYGSTEYGHTWNNSFHHNFISDNSLFGINAPYNEEMPINATDNWWGDSSGPYHDDNNPYGKGDKITNDVEFDPWIGKRDNSNPVAHIESISPNPSAENMTTLFLGYGIDDGTIMRYSWRNDEHELYNGTNSTFTYSNLTLGNHTIYLTVQDDFGIWSNEVSANLEILKDTDGDGIADIHDAFPNDPAASNDTDNDGYPEQWNEGKSQSDSTSIPPLKLDRFPDNLNEWNDTDEDGVGDNSDAFPADPAASMDGDGDGYPDEWNDGKTIEDSSSGLRLDEFPDDPEKWEKDESSEGFLPGFEIAILISSIVISIIIMRK